MSNVFHTDTLTEFNLKLYDGLLRHEHIVSNELMKKYNDEEYWGYVLEKENPKTKLKDRYFLRTLDIPNLPLKVDKMVKFSFRSDVFQLVTHSSTMKIPSRQDLSMRDMINFYASYDHSNYYHWLLARIIAIAGYCERLNIRIVSEASFGKDALVDILGILNGNVANLYNATLAKLKYSLNNDMIIINELGGLKKEEVGALQVYLTQAGAYKPKYENNSRSAMGTKEVIDLQNKTHIIYHNTPNYYFSKGQQYFEQMFTDAIMDRFPALLLTGYVTQDFTRHKPINEFPVEECMLKKLIASLNYYKDNKIQKSKYEFKDWGFKGKELQRSLRSFTIISKYIAEFSESESEFMILCNVMKQAKDDYKNMISGLDYTNYRMKVKEEYIGDVK